MFASRPGVFLCLACNEFNPLYLDIYMKLMSWNVNGLRSVTRKHQIQRIIGQEYDVIFLQETKTDDISEEVKRKEYFQYIMSSTAKKGYSGVMTLCRSKPAAVIYGIGSEDHDKEGRVITVEFEDFFAVNAYFPNSRRDLSRLDYKLEFNRRLLDFMERLREKKPVIIGGDFNVAHKDIDIARPRQNEGNAGFTEKERKFIDELLSKGYVDTFRIFNKEGGNYSWWSYIHNARQSNIGWRIDYFFVSNELENKVKSAYILREQEGSDHVPVSIEMG